MMMSAEFPTKLKQRVSLISSHLVGIPRPRKTCKGTSGSFIDPHTTAATWLGLHDEEVKETPVTVKGILICINE